MSSPQHHSPGSAVSRRDLIVASVCGAVVAMMVGMSYAAVPLYDWFCRTTGFGGRTQVATAAPAGALERRITVRFDANVGPGLPWRLEPEHTSIVVRIGEVVTVYYRVINQSARATTGISSYNVTPPTVGAYFQKISCFCFTEQHLKPGEKQEWPVVFFIDPSLVKDREQGGLDTITLSYTAHPVRQPERPVAQGGPAASAGRVQ